MASSAEYRDVQIDIGVITLDRKAALHLKRVLPTLLSPRHSIRRISDMESSLEEINKSELHALILIAGKSEYETLSLIQAAGRNDVGTPLIVVFETQPKPEFEQYLLKLGALDCLNLPALDAQVVSRALGLAEKASRLRKKLAFRRDFDDLIGKISTLFIKASSRSLDQRITDALSIIGKFTKADRSFILIPTEAEETISMTHEWHGQEVTPAMPFYQHIPMPIFDALLHESDPSKNIQYQRVSDLPATAGDLKEILLRRKVKSFIQVPMVLDRTMVGYIGLATLAYERSWSADIEALLEISGQIIITALRRRSAEEALLESEHRYEVLIEGLGEGILYCNRNDAVIHINSRFASMMGYRLEEVRGKAANQVFFAEEAGEKFRYMTERRLRGISEAYEIEMQRKDGSTFWAEVNATPVRNAAGDIVGTLGAVTDISERVRARTRLYESERKYRDLVETSSDLIWAIDTEGRWTFVNKASKLIYGHPPESIVGRKYAEFVSPALITKDIEALKNVLKGHQLFQYETEHLKADGSSVKLSLHAKAVYDESGTPIGISGTAADISERKQFEQDLLDQKEFLSLVIDTNPNLIYAKDQLGRFTLVNKATCEVFGRSRDEILGRRIEDLYAHQPEEMDIINAQDREIFEKKVRVEYSEEKLIHPVTKDPLWYDTIKQPLFDVNGNVVQMLGISTDLTGKRRAETALRRVLEGTVGTTAEDFFSSLVDHLGQALGADFAFLGALTEQGDAIQTRAFWSGGQLRENMSFQVAGTPSHNVLRHGYQEFTNNVQNLFPKADLLARYEVESFVGAPIVSSSGQTIGLLAVLSKKPLVHAEISKYLINIFASRAGAEFDRLSSEIERIELQRQLTQSQKMEAIGQLASGVAHDLNNALSAVVGHLQLLSLSKELAPELQESLDVALSGCERAASLIDQLLGFSRQGKYNVTRVSLQKVVADTLRFLGRIIDQRIQIQTIGTSEELYVSIDQNQVQQALTNLIINAQQAIRGSGTITFEFEASKVEFPARFNANASGEDFAVLRVHDTGSGIPSSIIDKIFEPFFTTKEQGQGSGLGLAMVYGIMQNHGGWISARNSLNKGAVFSLYFPASSAPAIGVRSSEAESIQSVDGHILLIDDEAFLVDLGCKFLERSGFKVTGFTDASEALEWYEVNHDAVDVIILDLKMPKLDGPQCFEQIRKINPNAQVVLLSGYIQDDAANDLLRQGAVKFFRKPLKYQEIIRWISSHIGQTNPSRRGYVH